MPRKKLERQPNFPYHVTTRANNREFFKVPMHRLWNIFYDALIYARQRVDVKLHSFVLMGNHYHLIITTPNCNLDKFMESFNRKLSWEMKKVVRDHNHKFANRYKWTIIKSRAYLYNVYRYVYQNPVRAGLCRMCLDYPYSSLRLTPTQKLSLRLNPHLCYFRHRSWMEQSIGVEFDTAIKKALRRSEFSLSVNERKFVRESLDRIPLSC